MPELTIDSTYGVIVLKDLESVYVDDNYARIFGYNSSTELMSNIGSFLDFIDPEFHQAARDNYYLQISGKMTPRGRTFKNIDRDGRTFTVFTIDHVIEWEGAPALQVTVIDMSIVEKAHQQLKENERKYKRLITTSGQGITVHKNFIPVMVNQAWVDLMHAPSIEYVLNNVSLMDFIPESEHELARQQYDDIISGKAQGVNTVLENICFDGVKRYFSVYDNRIEWDGEPAMQAVIEDVTKKVELEKKLKYYSVTDALTQISNRHRLDQVLTDETNCSNRYPHKFSVILIDLDYFKSINDSWGHQAGDDTLVAVAKVLKETVRKVDIVGRWGGEEFLVICPNTELLGASSLAEKLRIAIEILDLSDQYSVTASMGVAMSRNDESRNQLLLRADTALYTAKSEGRNRVVVNN